ncbi:threonine synthase [Litorilinea aerophila]|uniref:Threonine synthase n=1 Tax=Litorilinea aerophila TaxID=1204385 RepID=A0A540VHE8_9CHLR|nr:threonine synthase [Litorilinea aerophila]MCC9076155.1 threonine synthase [Litorilinea aerophila]OUC06049.1 threonine synthase [Litorilinea aerophila]
MLLDPVQSPSTDSTYRAYFRCFRGCPGEYSIYEVIYTCPHCGGLLEVHHDLEALRSQPADYWKRLIDSRVGTTRWPYGSGVWGMREWIAPDLRDENVVSMYEGNTNLFWAERLGKQIGVSDLWVKLCGNSHTGSFKDLGMTVLVSVVKQMMADGSPVRAVACASTGDTSAALAAYAACAGIPAIIFLPQGKVSTAQLVQPVANGAHVLALDTDFDGCMRIVREVTQDNTIYLANSMNSIRIEGQKTVGIEIVRQFDWEVPDWIIIPVGNLGNISALYKGLRLLMDLGITDRMPRLVAAQAEKANPFYRSYQQGFAQKARIQADKTLATAIQIGDPVSYEKAVQAIQATDGIVEQASEDELANAAALADLTGMYTCPHTGVALAVLFKLVERGEIRSRDRVVVISTAHGLKFTSFKVGYHEGRLEEVESRYANPPVYLPADADVVRETIARKLKL